MLGFGKTEKICYTELMNVFGQLAVVMGLAAVGGVVAKALKQPVLLGYILAGILLSGGGFFSAGDTQALVSILGQLGIVLLLFLVGLELPLPQLLKLGRVAVLTGVGQVIVTGIFAYVLSLWLGFSLPVALFLAVALTFSSTIVIVKLLSEKGEMDSLPARIALGSLLIQDFVAIGVLVILSGWSPSGNLDWWRLVGVVGKGAGLTVAAVWLSGKLFTKVLGWLGKSTELLFIASVGWCLAVAALVSSRWIGLSSEIGGLLAGLALANSATGSQIMVRIRPLRDFFLTWFFVALGATAGWGHWWAVLPAALILSAFVLVVKPLVMWLLVGWSGYGRRVAFLSGLSLGQISEFSLLIVALGVKLGQLPANVLTLITLIGLLTMTISSYLISQSHLLYSRVGKKLLGWLPQRQAEGDLARGLTGHAVLFGHNRTGKAIATALQKLGLPLVVVDFDPQVISDLTERGITAVYGDAADVDLHDKLAIDKAKVVVSTVSGVEDNLHLLNFIGRLKRNRPTVVVTAPDQVDAARLYSRGADYVLVPHEVGGEYLAHLLHQHGIDREALRKLR